MTMGILLTAPKGMTMTTATTNLLTISIHQDEDPAQAMAENWGSSYFLSKTKPKTPEVLARLAGKINQQVVEDGKRRRLSFWVVRKPPRQQGDQPKAKVAITLDADLLAQVDARAESDRSYRSTVIEAALREYLDPK
jgi:uncharacterized protein (DUF4415 family)